MDRFDRNIRLFGIEGQNKLRESHVVVIGCGGLGQHVIQQLGYLGVGCITLIDDEELSRSNLNRYVLAHHDDPIPGTHKCDLGARSLAVIDPEIIVIPIRASVRSEEAFAAMRPADYMIGCLDNDGARLILNEFSCAYKKPYLDCATDTYADEILRFGGRVAFVGNAKGCLVCMNQLDLDQAREDLESNATRRDRVTTYGVDNDMLDDAGPSVVAVNGVIASLAITEFMLDVTGMRSAKRLLVYRGDRGIVTVNDSVQGDNCYYCCVAHGTGDNSGIERYLLIEDRRHPILSSSCV
jgi:molybdopterin/thiamine biosynthesis adenylyltransferase